MSNRYTPRLYSEQDKVYIILVTKNISKMREGGSWRTSERDTEGVREGEGEGEGEGQRERTKE